MDHRFKNYKAPEIIQDHLNLGGKSPNGESIEINSLYIKKNGEPWIGVMGEYHFCRSDRSSWNDELSKIKAGGVNIVSTYVFWIYHEETEGSFDFNGDRELREFVKLCHEKGLYVFLRIGPWSHGECRNGGFPDWLLNKNIPLRQNSKEYLDKVRLFYERIFDQVEGEMFEDGGNIIGVQLENELGDNPEYLLALKNMAIDVGFKVPIYTVTGWNCIEGARIPVDEVLPVFGGYPEAPWAQTVEKLPLSEHYCFNTMRNDTAIGCDILEQTAEDGWRLPYELYPYATCELGGGMQATHHRRPFIKPMDIYAMSLVKLGSGNNLIGYYMYHGGTHKIGKYSTLQESQATGYPNDYPLLSYDFQAPISEFGEIREHYGLMNLLHLFVQDFGNILAPMVNVMSEYEPSADDKDSLRYCMRTDGNSGFIFVNHYQRLAQMNDVNGVVFDTGTVKFPPMNICGDLSFILPFNIMLGEHRLIFATAQLICRHKNAFFFAAIPGIAPEYRFDNIVYTADGDSESIIHMNGICIVTLPWESARFIRRIEDDIYIGEKCNIYNTENGIRTDTDMDFSYKKYNDGKFERFEVRSDASPAVLHISKSNAPSFEPEYLFELHYGDRRKVEWSSISVSSPYGFVDIDYTGDVAQIYADGKLVADDFFNGRRWRVSAEILYGKTCCLAVSELRNDLYLEI